VINAFRAVLPPNQVGPNGAFELLCMKVRARCCGPSCGLAYVQDTDTDGNSQYCIREIAVCCAAHASRRTRGA
jgi:hypothetical protein